MEVLLTSPRRKRGKVVEVVKAAEVARVMGILVTPTDLRPPMEEEKRRMDFLIKSTSPNSVVRKDTLVM